MHTFRTIFHYQNLYEHFNPHITNKRNNSTDFTSFASLTRNKKKGLLPTNPQFSNIAKSLRNYQQTFYNKRVFGFPNLSFTNNK